VFRFCLKYRPRDNDSEGRQTNRKDYTHLWRALLAFTFGRQGCTSQLSEYGKDGFPSEDSERLAYSIYADAREQRELHCR
jgi:hypothetical protein